MIRPIRAETERYGPYSRSGEFVYDHPFLWGSKRTGPDLHRIGGKYNNMWHLRHMEDPRAIVKDSIMPAYQWLLERDLDLASLPNKLETMKRIGVPYPAETIKNAIPLAQEQAQGIGDDLAAQGATDMHSKEITALIAYLQRLGTDIKE
jgi:cytochrome c oxidase cbb3-type subunit I/II